VIIWHPYGFSRLAGRTNCLFAIALRMAGYRAMLRQQHRMFGQRTTAMTMRDSRGLRMLAHRSM
jgi:hypothetical protein